MRSALIRFGIVCPQQSREVEQPHQERVVEAGGSRLDCRFRLPAHEDPDEPASQHPEDRSQI